MEVLNLHAVQLITLCRNEYFLNQMWGRKWQVEFSSCVIQGTVRNLSALADANDGCLWAQRGRWNVKGFPALLFLHAHLQLSALGATWGQHYIASIPWTHHSGKLELLQPMMCISSQLDPSWHHVRTENWPWFSAVTTVGFVPKKQTNITHRVLLPWRAGRYTFTSSPLTAAS